MAAKSGGMVEWASIIKPILAASYGSFNKNEIIELVKAIIKSDAEFLSHDEQHEAFYTSFAALAADYIAGSAATLSKNQIPTVWQACRILLTYLIGRLPQSQLGDGQPTVLVTKQLLLPIRALCMGQSLLTKTEEITLVAIMKNAKLPSHIKFEDLHEWLRIFSF